MSGVGSSLEIGSHTETMVTEGENAADSKKELENSFKEYMEDNQMLTTDWEGDVAEVFLNYSNNMNQMIQSAIGITDRFGLNIAEFYKQSMQLDIQASSNAEGEK